MSSVPSAIPVVGIRKWATSIEYLINDPLGVQEFASYLNNEFCLENITFWVAINNFKKLSESEILFRYQEIYDEFLAPGAIFEINIDSKTKENTRKQMLNPSKAMFDEAAEYVYSMLLKNDCYSRFIRSEHYKKLIECEDQSSNKIFFGFKKIESFDKDYNDLMKDISTLSLSNSQSRTAKSQIASPTRSIQMKFENKSISSLPHEFQVNHEAFTVYYSHTTLNSKGQSLKSAVDDMKVRNPVLLNDVCPWESVEIGDKAKLLAVTGERQPGCQISALESNSSVAMAVKVAAAAVAAVVTRQSTLLDESSSSDKGNIVFRACKRFQRKCCMGTRKTHNTKPKSLPKIQHLIKCPRHSSSSKTPPIAKLNGLKRFLSLSSVVKKYTPRSQTQLIKPKINVSMAKDGDQDDKVHIIEKPNLTGEVSINVNPTVYDGQSCTSGIVKVTVNPSVTGNAKNKRNGKKQKKRFGKYGNTYVVLTSTVADADEEPIIGTTNETDEINDI